MLSPSQVNWMGTVSSSEKAELSTSSTAPPSTGSRGTSVSPPQAASKIATSTAADLRIDADATRVGCPSRNRLGVGPNAP